MQTTVDFLNNWTVAREVRKKGIAWENPYDLGCVANWQVLFSSALEAPKSGYFSDMPLNHDRGLLPQEAFDAYGTLWWLRWLLPSMQMKRGSGMAFPSRGRTKGHETVASSTPSDLENGHPQEVASMV